MGSDQYDDALGRHRQIVRTATAAHEGTEHDTQGDGFFLSFSTPKACVLAAIAIQRGLAVEQWPEGSQLAVRMGAHTGEVQAAATGLVGVDVHRAARIAGVAHGGQILVSNATATLLEDAQGDVFTLRNLGSHRLKDLDRPVALFQVEAPGLPVGFPPLQTLDSHDVLHNLPTVLTPFVGRATELDELRTVIAQSRLVTLTGPGGSGKTRLALQLAADLVDADNDGVWFVDLSSVADPTVVEDAVVDALGVRRGSTHTSIDALVGLLSDHRTTLILDNCEHVIDAVAKVCDRISHSCQGVRILATSREPLGIEGEHVYRVRSMSLPSNAVLGMDDLCGSDAVQLLISHATALDPGLALAESDAPVLVSICEQLDGMPLAIELAAARLATMSPADLNERLDHRFRLLTGGRRNALPRQQTLESVVVWSYELLKEPEREMLRRLTVFADGFDLDVVEAVCSGGSVESFDVATMLGSLVNKSLVCSVHTERGVRYCLLQTIRQFAKERVAEVDEGAGIVEFQQRHADHYLALAERARPHLEGEEQRDWFCRLDEEWCNILAAFGTLVRTDRPVDVLRLGVACTWYSYYRAQREPSRYMSAALDTAVDVPPELRDRARFALALPTVHRAFSREDAARSQDDMDQVLRSARERGDTALTIEALAVLAYVCDLLEELERSVDLAREAVERAEQLGDRRLMARALYTRAIVMREGRDECRALLERCVAMYREMGNVIGMCLCLSRLSVLGLRDEEDILPAIAATEDALQAARRIDLTFSIANLSQNLADYHALVGHTEISRRLAREAIIQMKRLNETPRAMTFAFLALAWCAVEDGELRRASMLRGASEQLLGRLMPTEYDWSAPELRWRDEISRRITEGLGAEMADSLASEGASLSDTELYDLALERPADRRT